MPGTILVTGGLGYIGSHTCLALAEAGYALAIVDNLSNAKPAVLERLRELAPGAVIEFHCADLRDSASLERAFAARPIDRTRLPVCRVHLYARYAGRLTSQIEKRTPIRIESTFEEPP